MENQTDKNGAGVGTDMGRITEGYKFGGDVKVGGVILPPFLPSVMLDNCENKNDENGGDIYNNDDVTYHNCCFKDVSLVGAGSVEGESLVIDGGLVRPP